MTFTLVILFTHGEIMKDPDLKNKLSRRQFLKASGAASAVLGGTGLGMFGYAAGKDPESYTGWKNFEGGSQTFDREAWSVDKPTYEVVGPTSRVDARTGMIFYRSGSLRRQWSEEKGIDGLDSHLKEYYKKNPDDLELDLYLIQKVFPKFMKDRRKYKNKCREIVTKS